MDSSVAILLGGLMIALAVVFGPTIRLKLFERKIRKALSETRKTLIEMIKKVAPQFVKENPELIVAIDLKAKEHIENSESMEAWHKLWDSIGIPYEELVDMAKETMMKDASFNAHMDSILREIFENVSEEDFPDEEQ